MTIKKLMTRTFLIGPALAAMLFAGLLIGCASDNGSGEGRESGGAVQEVSERGGGEHGSGGESGAEGSEGAGGGEEAAANQLAPNETFDMIRSGARLVLSYDAASNAFTGAVENTTSSTLTRVRIEVHVANGPELGPTIPIDLAPGQVAPVTLSYSQPFTGWVAHAEVGSSEGGGAEGPESGGGESGPDGPEGPESGGGEAAREAAMSSPIIPLGQTWNGVLGGLAVLAWYDPATQSVQSTVQNTLPQVQCYVQAEPHLKSGTQTVGELGPDVLGHLSPGQQAQSSVSVATEPGLAGVSFDGYVVHLEVFDCGGAGPAPHAPGTGGEGVGGEGHGPGGEGSGGGEEATANQLAPNETFDMVRSGARLVMSYDAQSNSFRGVVQNTTDSVLTNVRIEVHIANGPELGPTTPIDLAPGQMVAVSLPYSQPFTGWVGHAEVGGGEHGSGSGGGEGSGEHSSGGGEGSGEHGSRGEGRSG